MILIPARLGSTRFPEKVLADIGGYPMVIATAKAVESIDRVAVATDSRKVMEVCSAYGIKGTSRSSSRRRSESSRLLFGSTQKMRV